MTTEFLEEKEVDLAEGNPVSSCLKEGGVALCNIHLGRGQEHYVMMVRVEDGWVYCFDSYSRRSLRGLRNRVSMLEDTDPRGPNLKIRVDWLDQEDGSVRFCLGPVSMRECLLIWRNR
jgi:hypothetical protein